METISSSSTGAAGLAVDAACTEAGQVAAPRNEGSLSLVSVDRHWTTLFVALPEGPLRKPAVRAAAEFYDIGDDGNCGTIIELPSVKGPEEVKAPQADAEAARICIELEVSGKMDFEPELLGVRVTESFEILMIHDAGLIAKHNSECYPDKIVIPGDRMTAVNG